MAEKCRNGDKARDLESMRRDIMETMSRTGGTNGVRIKARARLSLGQKLVGPNPSRTKFGTKILPLKEY